VSRHNREQRLQIPSFGLDFRRHLSDCQEHPVLFADFPNGCFKTFSDWAKAQDDSIEFDPASRTFSYKK
jgi:hypothetical protein